MAILLASLDPTNESPELRSRFLINLQHPQALQFQT